MRTILVIDDDTDILLLVSAFLRQNGFSVVTAEDGLEGLQLFETTAPDLVICDLNMPRIDGMEVLREVKRRSPFTPFVVFSGTNDIAFAVEALKQGAWDYLIKPLPGLELLPPLIRRLEEHAVLLREKDQAQARLEEQIKLRTSQLVRQLREKDVLLAEVHHRVKNNLQMILVLLGLQKERSEDAAVKAALESSEDRVRALAMVQDEMHDTDHAVLVDASGYISGMVHHWLSAHGLTQGIQLSLVIEDLPLRPSMAFACGLILNELMSSLASVSSSDSWEFRVSLRKLDLGRAELSLEDSRAPWERWLPEGKTSLGWELIAALAGEAPRWDAAHPTRMTITLT